ncbi:putative membrane protein SpoIIM required for sporulation [Curtobacterium sp. AG1037]|uniref:stage II sporulation protein M n=1 Tax=Curtobacterium sp. AG1037 TaxID=2183990 RepID=UPI000E0AA303|nr:stage II sporulation protein M [Curtobacterium sp. AG1037]RDI00049.1 putative membrane protein SpoIIM required for sporulation [Curtobacterium sp. AG1037]
MDLDAYEAVHRDRWQELDQLARARPRTGADADRLVAGYQAAATDLARIRAASPRTATGDRLSLTLFRARLRLTGTPVDPLTALTGFLVLQLPAALYRIRWLTLWVAAATAVVAAVVAVWISTTPGALETFGTPESLRRYATQDFQAYYSDHGLGAFTAQVWTNNAYIAASMVAFGITGLFVPYSIGQNAINLGVSAAIMHSEGRLGDFFVWIAPHGQLELYSIFLAGAAGLRIAWSWIAPGERTRGQALAEDGRALVTVALGLVGTLLLSGLVEGVVTRQDWPWPVKIGIGTVALAAVLWYQWVLGGRAYRAGQRGDVEEFERGATALVAG